MFLKKLAGPRVVRLPCGTILSMGDLPARNTRWVASRKADVVRAVLHGLLTREEALGRYGLTDEEFDRWLHNYATGGVRGLKVAAIDRRREAGDGHG